MTLKPGDSVLGPRRVPHVWAYTGAGPGRILIAFTPAGKMEAFFRDITRADAMPPHQERKSGGAGGARPVPLDAQSHIASRCPITGRSFQSGEMSEWLKTERCRAVWFLEI